MSPGRSRLVRFFVRRSTRAGPHTPGPDGGPPAGGSSENLTRRCSHARTARRAGRSRWPDDHREAAITEPVHPARSPAAPPRAPGRSRTPPSRRASGPAPRTRASSSSRADAGLGDLARRRTSTTSRCRSANAATCGRCVTTSTWEVRASAGEPPSDLERGPAADPGVDLVEHERRHRVRGRRGPPQTRASPGTARRPEAPLAIGRGRRPGVRGQQQLDLVDPLRTGDDGHRAVTEVDRQAVGVGSCRTSTTRRAAGIASSASSAVTRAARAAPPPCDRRPAQRGRRRPPGVPRSASRSVRSSTSRSSSPSSSASRAAASFAQASTSSTSVAVGPRSARRSAARRSSTTASRSRVGLDALGVGGRQVGGDVGDAGTPTSARRSASAASRGSWARTWSRDRRADASAVARVRRAVLGVVPGSPASARWAVAAAVRSSSAWDSRSASPRSVVVLARAAGRDARSPPGRAAAARPPALVPGRAGRSPPAAASTARSRCQVAR